MLVALRIKGNKLKCFALKIICIHCVAFMLQGFVA
jgi:hypothetical protein